MIILLKQVLLKSYSWPKHHDKWIFFRLKFMFGRFVNIDGIVAILGRFNYSRRLYYLIFLNYPKSQNIRSCLTHWKFITVFINTFVIDDIIERLHFFGMFVCQFFEFDHKRSKLVLLINTLVRNWQRIWMQLLSYDETVEEANMVEGRPSLDVRAKGFEFLLLGFHFES